MYLKMIVGTNWRGAADYAARGAETPEPMFSNLGGRDIREMSREVASLRSMRSGLRKGVCHLVLAHDPQDRDLTREEWQVALSIAREELGLSDTAFAAWNHRQTENDHLHHVGLLIDSQGRAISTWQNFKACERAARRIEEGLGLKPPTPVPKETRPGNRDTAQKINHHLHKKGSLYMLDLKQIKSIVEQSVSPKDLCLRLAEVGIEVRFDRKGDGGEIFGWSVKQAEGSHWVKGSQLDGARSLSWKKVQERMLRRRQAQVASNRELLGVLLDAIDASFQARLARDQEASGLEEEYRVAMGKKQKSLARLIAGLPVHAVRLAVAGLVNALAKLLERIFGLPPESLGRIKVPKFEMAEDVQVGLIPPASPAPGADVGELKRRAAAQKVMAGALDKACAAIDQQTPDCLPGLTVKDPEVQAARAEVFKSIEEANRQAEEEDADDQQEQERLR